MATQARWVLSANGPIGQDIATAAGTSEDGIGSAKAEAGKLPGYKKPTEEDFEEVIEPVPTEEQPQD